MTNHIQAKKNYVQAVRNQRKNKTRRFGIDSAGEHQLANCYRELQRLGIEPNYSLIAKELKDGKHSN